jgi:glycosyltransferase involved in cell wall biosynthesis
MKKKRLAIVSSYNESCGNASYTKALFDGLQGQYDVSVVALNVKLLRQGSQKRVQRHIRQICSQLASFDCVNIQFEAGLFGSSISQIQRRFLTIAKSCRNLVVTMHRVHGKDRYPTIASIAKMVLRFRFKQCLKSFLDIYANNRFVPLYQNIVRFCKARKVPIIVHTERDSEFIRDDLEYDLVFDHPLSFYDQSYIQEVANSYSREDFCYDFAFDPNGLYVGIFGFIGKYKGYETAIKALTYLPSKYRLVIFGAQHPHTIVAGEPINKYLESLIKLARSLGVQDRVYFHGVTKDSDFVKILLRTDFNVLPYLEVGQGGSGIAALSLETGSNALFSQNHAFFELGKYASGAFPCFSIGNYVELAQAIMSYRKEKWIPGLAQYNERYNLSTNVALYHKLLSRDFLNDHDDPQKLLSKLKETMPV